MTTEQTTDQGQTTPETETETATIRYGRPETVATTIAGLIGALADCARLDRRDWAARHRASLQWIGDNLLPSGSGIDRGTTINVERSNADRLVLDVPFHHMDGSGFYCGWTDYQIIVRPDWSGIRIAVKGRDRDGIKDYLAETYAYQLTRTIRARYAVGNEETTYERIADQR